MSLVHSSRRRPGLTHAKTLPCSCESTIVARGQVLEHVSSCFSLTFLHSTRTSNCCGDLIEMFVECGKRLHFWEITLFKVFFSFILAPAVWAMID